VSAGIRLSALSVRPIGQRLRHGLRPLQLRPNDQLRSEKIRRKNRAGIRLQILGKRRRPKSKSKDDGEGGQQIFSVLHSFNLRPKRPDRRTQIEVMRRQSLFVISSLSRVHTAIPLLQRPQLNVSPPFVRSAPHTPNIVGEPRLKLNRLAYLNPDASLQFQEDSKAFNLAVVFVEY
jgi:hypothetical protein